MRFSVVVSGLATRRYRHIAAIALLSVAFAFAVPNAAAARPGVVLDEVSHDPFTNPGYEHSSEVEPDVAAHGRTVVATYQVGRAAEGGAVAIGVAVSTDDGRTWSDRILQGSSAATGGHFGRASDPSVSYGAGGNGWLVGFLGVTVRGPFEIPTHSAVLVARSEAGGSFSAPVVVARAPRGILYDKPWVACDDHRTSAYFGRCYALWDELGRGVDAVVLASTSRDGGRHWSAPVRTKDPARGFGVIPVVRPDGSVTVVYLDTQDPFHPCDRGLRNVGWRSLLGRLLDDRGCPPLGSGTPGPRSRAPVGSRRGRRHDPRRLVRLSLRTVVLPR